MSEQVWVRAWWGNVSGSSAAPNIVLRPTRSGPQGTRSAQAPASAAGQQQGILRETERCCTRWPELTFPHPAADRGCEDTSVLGDAVFYLMELVDGFNVGSGLPALYRRRCRIRTRWPVGWLTRWPGHGRRRPPRGRLPPTSVKRRVSGSPKCRAFRLESYSGIEAYRDPEGHRGRGGGDLAATEPARTWLPGIMHGDYHAANVMFSPPARGGWRSSTGRCAPMATRWLDLGWMPATPKRPGHDSVPTNVLMWTLGTVAPD